MYTVDVSAFFTYSVYRVLEMSLCLDPACLFHRCHIITCQLPHWWKLIILSFLIANDAAMTLCQNSLHSCLIVFLG